MTRIAMDIFQNQTRRNRRPRYQGHSRVLPQASGLRPRLPGCAGGAPHQELGVGRSRQESVWGSLDTFGTSKIYEYLGIINDHHLIHGHHLYEMR
jgi:hypothetical protein